MKWKECVSLVERYDLYTRFDWPLTPGRLGFDCESVFTINDIWGAIGWVWTYPGDLVLNNSEVKTFFALPPETVVASGWSTALGWLILFVVWSSLLALFSQR